nr:endogenous retrovirus group K member 10 Gag polyprotein-like [Aotus nancymaae]
MTPLTHALLSNKKGFANVNSMFPSPFPVIEVQNAQGQIVRKYQPIPPETLKELKEAVAQYDPTAPYTISLLEGLAKKTLLLHDWGRLTKVCLSGGDYLLWRANYDNRAFDQAQRNRTHQIPVSFDMFTGKGQFEDLHLQAQLLQIAYGQINMLALQAWKQIPATGVKTEELAKIKQGPDEPYQDFVSCLLQAVGRVVQDGKAGTLLVKQLVFENANPACQAAIWPWKKKGTIADYIRLCADIGSSYQQGLAMATAQAGMSLAAYVKNQMSNAHYQRSNQKCFQCGNTSRMETNCY